SFEAGVWYGGEVLRTSLAEKRYWGLRFFFGFPGPPGFKPLPHPAFQATVRGQTIDLRTGPFAGDRAQWIHRTNYSATQALATSARIAGVQVIRYESVRDPEHAGCAAVLTPEVFVKPKPKAQETWFIAAGRTRVLCAQRSGPTYEFA